MIIERNAWTVGSLADANSHTFQNPEWQRRNRRKRTSPEQNLAEEDSSSLQAPPGYRDAAHSVRADLGIAISFGQTQDAFLAKVQEALQRMGELTANAGSGAPMAVVGAAELAEFAQLQEQIRYFGDKLFEAADLFYSGESQANAASIMEDCAVGLVHHKVLDDTLQNTYDPVRTALLDSGAASIAKGNIDQALATVAELRAKVGANLQHLSLRIEELSLQADPAQGDGTGIQDTNVAEERTRSLRHNILLQSGTAMLAQANAVPQSALRLLR